MPSPVPPVDQVHGVNWIPGQVPPAGKTTVHNFWLFDSVNGAFDIRFLREELDYIQSLGIQYVRVFQSYWGWCANKSEHVANLGLLSLELASRGMKALLVLFDGVMASSLISGDLREEPWYDTIEGAGTWSFVPDTIPDLVTILQGIETQTELDWAPNVPKWGNLLGGGWISGPGGLAVMGYAHESYTYPTRASFSAKWTEFHESMVTYAHDTIQAMQLGGKAVLWAVETVNEPEIWYVAIYPAILLSAWAPAEYPGLYLLTEAQAHLRVFAWMKWWEDYMRDQWPDVPITHGSVSLTYWAEEYAFGGLRPDFWSFHTYGQVPEGDIANAAILRSQAAGITGICMSEYWRSDINGDAGCLTPLLALRENLCGSFHWEVLATAGFLFDSDIVTNWNSAPPPVPNTFYPTTGIAYLTGTSYPRTLVQRRPDLEGQLTHWFTEDDATFRPEIWEVELTGPFSFRIVGRYGLSYPTSATTKVVWRWAIVTQSDKPAFGDSNFTSFPGIGKFLDVADESVQIGSTTWDSGLTEGSIGEFQWVIVQAWIGETDYDPTDFDNSRVAATLPLVLTKWQTVSGELDMALETRGKVVGALADRGVRIEHLSADDPHRSRDFLVAPVHDPTWYLSDDAPETRAAGHVYRIPPRVTLTGSYDPLTASIDRDAWQAPSVSTLRNIKPPSGFPTLCYRLTVGASSSLGMRLRVKGLDCLLRKVEEDIDIAFAASTEAIVWGKVGFREIREIEVLQNDLSSGVTSYVLTVGWYFEAKDTISGGNHYFDEPHEVGHNSSVAITMTGAGDVNDYMDLWDGVNNPIRITLVAAGAVSPQINIAGTAALTAANLKSRIDGLIGSGLGNWLSTSINGATVTVTNSAPEQTRKTIWTRPPIFMAGSAATTDEVSPVRWSSFSVQMTPSTPQWRTGFPFPFVRDDSLGYMKTKNVQGHVLMDLSAWHSHDREEEVHSVAVLPTSFGGGFGFPQHYRSPLFEDGVFDSTWNTWAPPLFGRPRVSAGHDGGTPRIPINHCAYQLYRFLLNERFGTVTS